MNYAATIFFGLNQSKILGDGTKPVTINTQDVEKFIRERYDRGRDNKYKEIRSEGLLGGKIHFLKESNKLTSHQAEENFKNFLEPAGFKFGKGFTDSTTSKVLDHFKQISKTPNKLINTTVPQEDAFAGIPLNATYREHPDGTGIELFSVSEDGLFTGITHFNGLAQDQLYTL